MICINYLLFYLDKVNEVINVIVIFVYFCFVVYDIDIYVVNEYWLFLILDYGILIIGKIGNIFNCILII